MGYLALPSTNSFSSHGLEKHTLTCLSSASGKLLILLIDIDRWSQTLHVTSACSVSNLPSSFSTPHPAPHLGRSQTLRTVYKGVVESPLIEEFLDCDRLCSDSDGDTSSSVSSRRPSLKRLHINIDMTSAQYLTPGPHHSERIDGLPRPTVCSRGDLTVSYSSPELDPYSATSGVSSFNYPAAADPSLLTPVSSAGSPPLLHKAPTKPMRSYRPSQSSAPGSQVPTPPSTANLYYNGYDVNATSQASSPMTVNPAATEAGHFDMTPYIAHSPPASQHPSSPKAEIPPPIHPYLGHFTVSGANDGETTHHSLHEYHPYSVEVGSSSVFLGQQHVPVGTPHHMHHRMPSDGQAPVLSQPQPSQYRPPSAPRIGSIEDLRGPAVLLGSYPSHLSLSPERKPQPRKKFSSARKQSRNTPKATPQTVSNGLSAANGQFDEDETEELTLRDDAPEDDKYLFQLRKQFLSEKGKGMWEEMKAKYSEKHQGNWEKAALQMKVSRAVAKYGEWPKREIERLLEAHRYIEERRYQLILARMKENGGCRVWDWKPQHIEAMLVKLGMEEPTIDEKTGSRRRRNKVARRRASPQNGGGTPHHAAVMGEWQHNALGLHAAFPGHPHHAAQAAAAARQASFDGVIPDDASVAPTFTSEQENEYLDQIFNKPVKAERDLSPEAMELAYDDGGNNNNNNSNNSNNHNGRASQASGVTHREPSQAQQRSERVARQACEQLMHQQ
ncbi:hypothetical protein VTK56DRAFT_1761 [Thermocarpiscus australiensis]